MSFVTSTPGNAKLKPTVLGISYRNLFFLVIQKIIANLPSRAFIISKGKELLVWRNFTFEQRERLS
jgi:hypothetical protein